MCQAEGSVCLLFVSVSPREAWWPVCWCLQEQLGHSNATVLIFAAKSNFAAHFQRRLNNDRDTVVEKRSGDTVRLCGAQKKKLSAQIVLSFSTVMRIFSGLS